MNPEEMITKHRDLGKIDIVIQYDILNKKFGVPYNEMVDKTFSEMGFGVLDSVEFIMELEKRLDIYIPDDYIEFISGENIKPINFTKYTREYKLNQIGI